MDESFFPDAVLEARFPGLTAAATRPTIRRILDEWPATIPKRFDQIFLREVFKDEHAELTYALFHEPGGWRVWKTVDLVAALRRTLGVRMGLNDSNGGEPPCRST